MVILWVRQSFDALFKNGFIKYLNKIKESRFTQKNNLCKTGRGLVMQFLGIESLSLFLNLTVQYFENFTYVTKTIENSKVPVVK